MKHTDIHQGGRYVIRLAAPTPGAPKLALTKTVTIIDKPDTRTVTVEWTEPVCINLDHYQNPGATHGVAWAMLNGRLRYQPRPVRRPVRAADVLRPAPSAVADAAVLDTPPSGPAGATAELVAS